MKQNKATLHLRILSVGLFVYLCVCRETAQTSPKSAYLQSRQPTRMPAQAVRLEMHSDTELNTPCAAGHGAGSHLLARYACHAASNALWICLACCAGIGAAVNDGTKKTARWTRYIQDSIPGSLRGVDFRSLQTAAAAAIGTKHTTQEFAEVKHDLWLQA